MCPVLFLWAGCCDTKTVLQNASVETRETSIHRLQARA
nr:MAG TPA: hypothetical protein [Bacteriophage sp.]DAG16974.1 MAG TPA: hypothetical protein [Caudoviricetes sp.]DAJ54036.1 MAG TPA: hypothetical protein [Caudoviricetes sp.]DAM88102.1 MAG TPA: hypothetical protein [Caudoviricetes sp.]DAM88138.1 MAG TPA: hypothetical protein [Caudoviricetes sp.]